MSIHQSPTLRHVLRVWLAIAFLATLAVLAATSVAAERTIALETQVAAGEALLAHLAAMPELGGDPASARRQLDALAPALAATGADVEMARAGPPRDPAALAWRRLPVAPGDYELRYRARTSWLWRITRRALLVHFFYGALGFAVLLVGSEWILRTRLAAPLGRIAHQVRFMGSGGGWQPKLPPADAEIGEVERALEELGPALQGQVLEWIEAERRAGVASTLAEVRKRLRNAHQEALALLGDLQARGAVTPEAKPRLRALTGAMERLTAAIQEIESEAFGRPPTPRRDIPR